MASRAGKRASTRRTRGIETGHVESRLAPIGEVKDALESDIDTVKAPEAGKGAETKERDTSTNPDITTVAELKEWHRRRGTAPSREETDKVRKLENEVLEAGGKELRTNPKE